MPLRPPTIASARPALAADRWSRSARRCSSRSWAASPAVREPPSVRTPTDAAPRRPPTPAATPVADADHAAPVRPDRRSGDGHVLRPRLRPRRRDVAVRRTRPGARRPDVDRRSSPTTTRARRSGTIATDDADPGPGPVALAGRRRPRRSSSTAGARPGRSTASRRSSRSTRRSGSIRPTTTTATGPRTTWRIRVDRAGRHGPARRGQAGQRRRCAAPTGDQPLPALVEARLVRPVPRHPPDPCLVERRRP